MWTSISHESAGKIVLIKERRDYSQAGQLPYLRHTVFTAIRSIKVTSANVWYSKHKASRGFSPALLCSAVGFIFPFLLFSAFKGFSHFYSFQQQV